MTRVSQVALATCVMVACGAGAGQAQEPSTENRLKVFLDCQSGCDQTYIRTEIQWVEYVLDRQVSDVHVLVTTRTTGPGGREFTLYFVGRGAHAAKADTLRYVSSPDHTEEVRRRGLVQTLKTGLVRYVAGSAVADRLQISLPPAVGPPGAPGTQAGGPPRDPWNFWVFTISGNGFLNGESQQDFSNLGLSLSANRTTDAWKIRLSTRGNYSESSFEIDSVTTITSIRRSYSGRALLVKSLGARLSAGLQAEIESSTFGNIEAAVRLAPAVEYNFFPYTESTRRSFTLLYSLGINDFDYRERTIFDEIAETRPAHSLTVGYSTRQTWGSTSFGLSASQFLHDATKYRWSAAGNANIRLFRGLSLNVGGSYSRVRDQLAVPAGSATPEQILLRQRLLRTNFFYFANFGLSYRFGSIYSTVVNTRFAQGLGGGEMMMMMF